MKPKSPLCTDGSNRHPSVQPEIFEGMVPHLVAVPTEREVRRSNLAKFSPREVCGILPSHSTVPRVLGVVVPTVPNYAQAWRWEHR